MKLKLLLLLIIFYCTQGKGQKLYLSIQSDFHFPVTHQTSPDYCALKTRSIFGVYTFKANTTISDFSVAKGFNYGLILGYSMKEFLSIELGFNYYNNSKKQFDPSPKYRYALNVPSSWNFKNYSLAPGVIVSQTYKKSSIGINLSCALGIADLEIEYSLNSDYQTYSFDKWLSYSFSYGMQYLYRFSERIYAKINAGIENTYYTPRHAEMTSSSYNKEYLSTWQKEIDYVKEIRNQPLVYNYNMNSYTTDPDKPEQRIRESLKLNSIYFGVGLKFIIAK